MSITNRISAVSTSPAPTSSATATRAPAFGQDHAVEGTPAAAYVTRFEAEMDFSSDRRGFSQQDGRQRDPYAPFLNAIGKFAIGYVANEEPQGESPGSFQTLLFDAMRAVGVYENNMRVVAGTDRANGTMLNFYL